MDTPGIVIDTNVLVSALRSRRGASYRLMMLLGSERFSVHISVPLVLEYEAVATRLVDAAEATEESISDILDYLCQVATHHKIFYLWRPLLKDPGDDMVLELAVSAGSEIIVTHNVSDFRGAEQFGLRILTPGQFLSEIGDLS